MEYKEFDSKLSNMLEKIGNESSNLILDDVAVLLTDNRSMNEELDKKEAEITNLKNLNSRLQQVNSNLLLQIPVERESKKEETNNEDSKKYNIYTAFDDFGNFKK